jgi:hypothetical protein
VKIIGEDATHDCFQRFVDFTHSDGAVAEAVNTDATKE